MFVSLLLHTDNHHYTQQSSLTLDFSQIRGSNLACNRVIWGMAEDNVDLFSFLFYGSGLFVSFRIYIYNVEYIIEENSFISVTKG